MPGIKFLSGQELRDILKANGFVFVSQKSSHMKLRRKIEVGSEIITFTAIVPDHKTLKIGTLSSIVRQSGLQRELFEK